MSITASIFSSTFLDSTATSSSIYYQRNAINKLNASLEDAVGLGTLKTNATQLNATAQVSQSNSENFYKFSLDGDSLKLSLTNGTNTSKLRFQLMDSSGTVIADNSSNASEQLQEAFEDLNSEDGLDAQAGDYYARVTFDSGQLRSVPQSYSFSLYSGTKFRASYETIAMAQTSASQHVSVDNSMVFSTIDALAFSTDKVHRFGGSFEDAINIGWLYENKSALSINSMLTNAVPEHFYNVTLQKGESLKMAFDNRTDTATARVQIFDPTGTYLHADSHGTEAQKEAYAALLSSDGLALKTGQYGIKISFAPGESRNEDQTYNFKLYTGESYENYYETYAATETIDTALISGNFTSSYSPLTSLVAYLEARAYGENINVMDILREI